MAKPPHTIIESRNYNLSKQFPVLLLTGDIWRISDVPSSVLHFHNCLEIGMCESDSGVIKFSTTEYRFKKNDITVVATDVPHTTYSDKGKASKWTYIFVDIEELLTSYVPLNIYIDTKTFYQLIHTFHGIFSKKENEDIYLLVNAIIEELSKKPKHYELSVRGLFLDLIVRLINIMEAKPINSEDHINEITQNQMVIAPALYYIRNHYSSDFSIDDLARECNMSTTHFRRIFTEIMQVAPLAYINSYRITQAAILIRITNLPILEISETVGFKTISSFNRQFLDIMGTNPMKWRKEMSYIQNRSVLKYSGWMSPPKD